MHYTKKTTINKEILCRFQKHFFQGSENWNLILDVLRLVRHFFELKKTLVFGRFASQERTIVHRKAFFLHTPDFSSSKVKALKVVWGKDTSERRKEPGSDLPPCFSAWAPFCKCGHDVIIYPDLVVARTAQRYCITTRINKKKKKEKSRVYLNSGLGNIKIFTSSIFFVNNVNGLPRSWNTN